MADQLAPACECGCTIFIVPYKVSGIIYVTERHDQSTEGLENTGMWDNARTKRSKRPARCYDCNAVIPTVK